MIHSATDHLSNLPDPFPREVLHRHFSLWLRGLSVGENVWVTFAPQADRVRRTQDFISFVRSQEEKENTRQFKIVSLAGGLLEDRHDFFHTLFNEVESTTQPFTYIFKDAELLLTLPDLAHTLDEVHENHSHVTFLFLSEKFLDVKLPTSLHQNRDMYPLYSQEGTNQFITYLEQKFSTTVTKNQRKEIYTLSGGHTWLIKEAVRLIARGVTDFAEAISFTEKVQVLFDDFTDQEKEILGLVHTKKPITQLDKSRYQVMCTLGITKNNMLCIKALEKPLVLFLKKSVELYLKNDQIMAGGVVIGNLLSNKTKSLLTFFLQNQKKLVTREEVAQVIWNDESDEYSDWVFDQTMHRFRKKLLELGLPAEVLKTVKGRGFYASFD